MKNNKLFFLLFLVFLAFCAMTSISCKKCVSCNIGAVYHSSGCSYGGYGKPNAQTTCEQKALLSGTTCTCVKQ